MDGQSNLHSDVVLVLTPVQFDKQREKQCEVVSPFREPCLCPLFGTRNDLLFIKAPLNDMRLVELVNELSKQNNYEDSQRYI